MVSPKILKNCIIKKRSHKLLDEFNYGAFGGFSFGYGISNAQFRLGYCYFYGYGVNKNYREAYKYLKMAYDNDGNENAKLMMDQLDAIGNYR